MTATVSRELVVTTPSDTAIDMQREFDAPKHLVYEAHTSAEHVSKWWGPRKYAIEVDEYDFRAGGKWRMIHTGPDGDQHAFRGEFREIVPDEKIVWTFEYEGAPGNISVETLSFEEVDGKTILRTHSTCDTKEQRDAILQSGMEDGARETWERLEEYVQTLS